YGYFARSVEAFGAIRTAVPNELYSEPVIAENGFSVEVLVDGRPVPEYAARGRQYVEAFENAEYELRIHNPLGTRVEMALSSDGLNTIDARHTGAWDAHKWVIEPYGTIYVRGWQMSSENARRFYFTSERDSRSEEHTSELQSRGHLVCRLLLEKKKKEHRKHNR